MNPSEPHASEGESRLTGPSVGGAHRGDTAKLVVPSFAAALAIMLASGLATYRATTGFLKIAESRRAAQGNYEAMESLLSQLKDAETGQRGYVITGEPSYLEPYQSALQTLGSTRADLHNRLRDIPDQQRDLEALDSVVAQKLAELDGSVALRRHKGFQTAQRGVLANRGKQTMDDIRAVVARMEGRTSEKLMQRDAEARASARNTGWILLLGNATGFGLLLAAFYFLNREVRVRTQAEGRVHQLNQELEHRNVELIATNQDLEAFTYSVSHDLRSPLRHIDGFSKLLIEDYSDTLPEGARKYLTRVREGTRQMGQLVDDLLNLARVGRQELKLQVTGLNSLVEEVINDLKAEAPQRAIDWKIQSLPFTECDPALIRQVFANLLSNALKYTRPRERAVIEVGVAKQDGEPVIFVRDNGVGFSLKYADKLFGVFQRLHRQEDFEGTGVGLATVQRIIRKHGGRVWAQAEIDRGAAFFFTLGTLEVPDEMRRAA